MFSAIARLTGSKSCVSFVMIRSWNAIADSELDCGQFVRLPTVDQPPSAFVFWLARALVGTEFIDVNRRRSTEPDTGGCRAPLNRARPRSYFRGLNGRSTRLVTARARGGTSGAAPNVSW